jgi:Rrf2 family protein
MRTSAKAEYACVAMLELAASSEGPQPVRIKTIAERTGIPLRFLVQILLQLKTAGLVASVRGAAGGYQLTRSPEAISLASVVFAIDNRTLAPSSALNITSRRGRTITPSPVVDALLDVWKEVQAEELRLLERLTLAELLRRAQRKDALIYQI